MRRVTLAGSGTTTSALGFGCAALGGKTGRRGSLRLLDAAFDAGITHFDVARMYGYGQAEAVLAEFLRRRRGEVTVTTKLGIDPPPSSGALAVARSAARQVVRVAPSLRRVARRGAQQMVATARFDVADARASLETSLRELGAERVDVLLLHECRPDDVTDELVAFLEARVADGTVGALGTATDPAPAAQILRAQPDFGLVVQIPNSLTVPGLSRLPNVGARSLITHSALGGGLAEIERHLDSSTQTRERWSQAVDADLGDPRALGELMLAWAVLANPDGIVLFSSRDPARIAANARLSAPEPRREGAARLAELVREELGPHSSSISSTSGSPPS